MADRPITDLENSEGGERSVLVEKAFLAVGIVAACVIVLLLFVGFSGFGYLD
jgi:hypothetical protein